MLNGLSPGMSPSPARGNFASQVATQIFSPEEEATQAYIESGDTSGGFSAEEAPWAKLVFACDRAPIRLFSRPGDASGRANLYTVGRCAKRGKVDPDVAFEDPRVSSQHCAIYVAAEQNERRRGLVAPSVYIVDGSANGTYVNNGAKRIGKGEARLLNNGDEVFLVRPPANGRPGADRSVIEATSFTFVNLLQRQLSGPARGIAGRGGGDEDEPLSQMAQRRILDEYEIYNEIGRGTAGVVHLGVHRATGRQVAVKVMEVKRLRFSSAGAVGIRELTEEATLLQTLRHEGIISVEDVFCDDPEARGGAVYVVMELVKGGDLFDRIVARGVYDEDMARELLRRVFAAVAYLHGKNIVHRDLKPENILLVHPDDDVVCKISDFGLAKRADANGLKTFCGTPAYFAPEVLRRRTTVMGRGRYGREADMWSLGVIMYILLSGRQPFNDATLFDQIETAAYRVDGPAWSGVSDAAKDLLRQLLDTMPERRISAAAALQQPWFAVNARANLSPLDPRSPMPSPAPKPRPGPTPKAGGSKPPTPRAPRTLKTPVASPAGSSVRFETGSEKAYETPKHRSSQGSAKVGTESGNVSGGDDRVTPETAGAAVSNERYLGPFDASAFAKRAGPKLSVSPTMDDSEALARLEQTPSKKAASDVDTSTETAGGGAAQGAAGPHAVFRLGPTPESSPVRDAGAAAGPRGRLGAGVRLFSGTLEPLERPGLVLAPVVATAATEPTVETLSDDISDFSSDGDDSEGEGPLCAGWSTVARKDTKGAPAREASEPTDALAAAGLAQAPPAFQAPDAPETPPEREYRHTAETPTEALGAVQLASQGSSGRKRPRQMVLAQRAEPATVGAAPFSALAASVDGSGLGEEKEGIADDATGGAKSGEDGRPPSKRQRTIVEMFRSKKKA